MNYPNGVSTVLDSVSPDDIINRITTTVNEHAGTLDDGLADLSQVGQPTL